MKFIKLNYSNFSLYYSLICLLIFICLFISTFYINCLFYFSSRFYVSFILLLMPILFCFLNHYKIKLFLLLSFSYFHMFLFLIYFCSLFSYFILISLLTIVRLVSKVIHLMSSYHFITLENIVFIEIL